MSNFHIFLLLLLICILSPRFSSSSSFSFFLLFSPQSWMLFTHAITIVSHITERCVTNTRTGSFEKRTTLFSFRGGGGKEMLFCVLRKDKPKAQAKCVWRDGLAATSELIKPMFSLAPAKGLRYWTGRSLSPRVPSDHLKLLRWDQLYIHQVCFHPRYYLKT